MNFFKDKFSRPKKLSTSESVSSELGGSSKGSLPYFTTVETAGGHNVGGRGGQQQQLRPFPPSLSTGSFTPFQSQTSTEIKTFPRSATTHTFNPTGGRARPLAPLNGSITSSSQSSDESEDCGQRTRAPRRRPGYRSTSLPRHSSAGSYRRSVTMPNFQQQPSGKSQDDAAVGDNSRQRTGGGESESRRSEDNKQQQQAGRGGVILGQIENQGRGAGQGSPQLTSWLQSLADVPEWSTGKTSNKLGGTKGSKSEILRISRGRLKEEQAAAQQLDNKRKRNSSRENSLESLLEEEDQTSEDCTSRDSLPFLDEEDPTNRGPEFRPQQNQKNSLESLLEDQSGLSAMKHKTNSLPKSSFSNIQLRVQEIRDQLEVLKQSSSSSGSKALQQVFPRIRPPNLVTNDFTDNENFEEKIKGAGDPLAVYSTPVNPSNPIYNNLNSSLSCSSRPGFLNNRPLSMPSPPLVNSPGNLSPNSISPRSLSPNGNSPKHNIRPSACYSQPPNPQHQAAESRGKRGRGGGEGASGLPNPFSEFAPSPVSSPSTLSPCSSNSLPSSQAGHSWLFWPAPSWRIMRRNANSFQIPRNFFIKLFSYCFSKRI